jgi:hypothetical protein
MTSEEDYAEWPEVPLTPDVLGVAGVIYTGPYFLSDDHGCFHGPSSHGCLPLDHCEDDRVRIRCEDGRKKALRHYRDLVVVRCLEAISAADLLYAWVENPTCFGTMAEIGFARGAGKAVFIASPGAGWNYWEDLWFVSHLACEGGWYDDPVDGLRAAVLWWQRSGWISQQAALPLDPVESSVLAVRKTTARAGPYSVEELKEVYKKDRAKYFATEHWQAVRNARIRIAKNRCEKCRKYLARGFWIHHLNYERIGCEVDDDVRAWCKECHEKEHGVPPGER